MRDPDANLAGGGIAEKAGVDEGPHQNQDQTHKGCKV